MSLTTKQATNELKGGTSWWEDITNTIGDTFSNATDLYANSWLSDQFGTTSEPQNAVETPQAKNADVANAPSVAFGFSQTQLMIGGAVALGAFFLIARKK